MALHPTVSKETSKRLIILIIHLYLHPVPSWHGSDVDRWANPRVCYNECQLAERVFEAQCPNHVQGFSSSKSGYNIYSRAKIWELRNGWLSTTGEHHCQHLLCKSATETSDINRASAIRTIVGPLSSKPDKHFETIESKRPLQACRRSIPVFRRGTLFFG